MTRRVRESELDNMRQRAERAERERDQLRQDWKAEHNHCNYMKNSGNELAKEVEKLRIELAERNEECEELRQAAQRQGGEAVDPTPEMIEAAAQRLVRWEDGCTWPDSWEALTVAAARQDAERALRSGLAVAPNPHKEAIDEALAAYARGKPVDEIMRELKAVQRDTV